MPLITQYTSPARSAWIKCKPANDVNAPPPASLYATPAAAAEQEYIAPLNSRRVHALGRARAKVLKNTSRAAPLEGNSRTPARAMGKLTETFTERAKAKVAARSAAT